VFAWNFYYQSAVELHPLEAAASFPAPPVAMAGNPPTLPSVAGTETDFNPNFDTSTPGANGNADALSPVDSPAPAPSGFQQEKHADGQDPMVKEQVERVLYSDIGVNTLLNRLKASIASARVCLSLLT
jgi:hypothetical protein